MTIPEFEKAALEIRTALLQGANLAFYHQSEMTKLSYDFELKKMELINKNLEEQVRLSKVMQEREFAQIKFQEDMRGEE